MNEVYANLLGSHAIIIPDSGSTLDTIMLSNNNNSFTGSNTFSSPIKLNNFIGSTFPYTGKMLTFAPMNGTLYTIQATNPNTSLTYCINDMGANSDFIFTNGSQTLAKNFKLFIFKR